MSIVSSKTSISDVVGVNNAVQHLQELAHRMTSDEFGFKDSDVGNIDGITEALHDLQHERAHVHEDLEVETINASILRRQLQVLPAQIRSDITAAVASARESNAAELTRLQEKLRGINENIDYLDKRYHDLEQENAKLHPDRDQVRKMHEEIIVQLNQRMAEKASKQIVLNETRDRLRTTNQKIVDLEDTILQLKEDLIQERADARMEKRRLKKAVYDTTLKTREQKEANIAKKKEVDNIHEKVLENENELGNIRKTIRRYETSRSRLEGQERALVVQLNREIQHNEELHVKGEEIAECTSEEQTVWVEKKVGLDEEITKLDKQIAVQEKRNEELSTKKDGLMEELKGKVAIKRADEKKVRESNLRLQAMKQELAEKAERIGELSQENIDMEAKIEELAEQHKAVMATMAQQVEEAREQLSKERKDRVDLQVKREDVSKHIDDFKSESNSYLAEMNQRIKEGKENHDKLTKEGTTLHKSIRNGDDKIQKLKADQAKLVAEHKRLKDALEREIAILNEEIVTMGRELEEKEAQVKEKLPDFDKLDKAFADMNKQYDTLKRGIVAKKNQKMGLEDSVKLAKRELEKMVQPKARLESDIKKRRSEVLQQLKDQAEDVREVEEKIYVIGCKLKTVLEENGRFTKANRQMDQDIVNVKNETVENTDVMEKLKDQFNDLREELAGEWAKDSQMQQEFANRDMLLVDALGSLLDRTEQRETIISDITNKLQAELGLLGTFLNKVATHRPKGVVNDTKGSKKGKAKDVLDIVADANMPAPTPSQFSGTPPGSPLPKLIPPIASDPPPTGNTTHRSKGNVTARTAGKLTSRSTTKLKLEK